MQSRSALWLCFPLAVFVAVATSAGPFWPQVYSHETPIWATEGKGGDAATLFVIVPTPLMIVAVAGMMAMLAVMSHTFAFKTPEGEVTFLEALELWPVPYEEIEIPTGFGTTHAIVSGPKNITRIARPPWDPLSSPVAPEYSKPAPPP